MENLNKKLTQAWADVISDYICRIEVLKAVQEKSKSTTTIF